MEYVNYRSSSGDENRKQRVLVVDDSPIMLRTISATLSGKHEVFALTRGAQVEKFLSRTIPDLFILDIMMPDINGYDLVPIIRSFEEHKDTPILFLTGNMTPELLSTALSLGVCEVLTKPIDHNILLDRVNKYTDHNHKQ